MQRSNLRQQTAITGVRIGTIATTRFLATAVSHHHPRLHDMGFKLVRIRVIKQYCSFITRANGVVSTDRNLPSSNFLTVRLGHTPTHPLECELRSSPPRLF